MMILKGEALLLCATPPTEMGHCTIEVGAWENAGDLFPSVAEWCASLQPAPELTESKAGGTKWYIVVAAGLGVCTLAGCSLAARKMVKKRAGQIENESEPGGVPIRIGAAACEVEGLAARLECEMIEKQAVLSVISWAEKIFFIQVM